MEREWRISRMRAFLRCEKKERESGSCRAGIEIGQRKLGWEGDKLDQVSMLACSSSLWFCVASTD